MAESDVPDDHRLAGRTPRSVRPGPPDAQIPFPRTATTSPTTPTPTTRSIRSTPWRA